MLLCLRLLASLHTWSPQVPVIQAAVPPPCLIHTAAEPPEARKKTLTVSYLLSPCCQPRCVLGTLRVPEIQAGTLKVFGLFLFSLCVCVCVCFPLFLLLFVWFCVYHLYLSSPQPVLNADKPKSSRSKLLWVTQILRWGKKKTTELQVQCG